MLLRKQSRRFEAEAQWRSEVSAQLTLLMNAQTKMAEFASLQLRDRKLRRPGWTAWIQAAFFLVISGLIVAIGIVGGAIAPLQTSNANGLFAKANSEITQSDNKLQPILDLKKREGETWATHLTKADLNDLASAERLAIIAGNDNSEASSDQESADRWQLEGPGLLTFGSALGGAVLGWILTQWLGSLRWPSKRGTKAKTNPSSH